MSINQAEAAEKIRYARRVYENLGDPELPKIVSDTIMSLELDRGARLISMPSRPPRGKAQMHIVLDEYAHCLGDREIYVGALPIISRGGRLRIGSSPLGASGTFWEILEEQLKPFPGYVRVKTPWWAVKSFCRETPIEPGTLSTGECVERYGNDRITAIYQNMLAVDFEQEYTCSIIDETISWIPWSLLKEAQDAELWCRHATSVDQALLMLPEIIDAKRNGLVENTFVGGVDLGRKHDLTEITLVGKAPSGHTPIRFMISLDRVKLHIQESCIRRLLDTLPITSMLIDQTGMGLQLAESLERDTIAEGITFTNPLKELWAVNTRLQFEQHKVPLPVDRKLVSQIHSIKRKATAAKNLVFDCESSEKHHADRFWSLALALWSAKGSSEEVHIAPFPSWSR